MRNKQIVTKVVAASLAAFVSVTQIPFTVSAADSKTVSIAGNTYSYATEALDGYTQIGNSGVYYKLTSGMGLSGNLYGKANLTYKEFYLGDVSSTDSFDAVTTATVNKSSVLSSAWTDYDKDTAEAAGGYHVKGVANVNVAVDSDLYVESVILKDADKELSGVYEEASEITLNENPSQAPAQYKTLQNNGSYVSNNKVIDTVTDAVPSLTTASTWGEYEIDVVEKSTKYLRNSREDTFAVGSSIQGIIVETTDGYKVGLEHLSNIWVQPYKLSFNAVNEAATTGIAKSDNTAEFKKLVNKTINKITYITPEGNYVYTFADGIYIKPAYAETVSGAFSDDMKTFTLNQLPTVKNGNLTVAYIVDAGHKKTSYTLYSGDIQKNDPLDFSSIPAGTEGGTYSVKITSDDYADISVAIPVTDPDDSGKTDPTPDSKPDKKPASKVKLGKQSIKVKTNGKKAIKVTWKKDKKASGYMITYSTKKSFKSKKTVYVKSYKTTSKVIKKLKAKKKYYVKVRSYKKSGKSKVYGAYSNVKSIKIK